MVYCTQCGVKINVDAKYCQNCGKSLENENLQHWKNTLKDRKDKSPLVAAILNLILVGLGFIYIKEYLKAILSFIIVLMVVLAGTLIGAPYIGYLALFLVIVWSYMETVRYNQNLDKETLNQIE